MFNIQLPPAASVEYSQRTQMGGADYVLRFAHNSRADTWSLDISTLGDQSEEGVPIIRGKKLFIGNDLLRYSRHPLKPAGKLFVLSRDSGRKAPGLNDLGDRVEIVYLEEGESFDA